MIFQRTGEISFTVFHDPSLLRKKKHARSKMFWGRAAVQWTLRVHT